MAKTKHEALAEKMSHMLINVDQFVEKGQRVLQLVQFHFYIKVGPLNVAPPLQDVLSRLAKSHAIGMSLLAPSQELRETCAAYPACSSILRQPFLLKSQCPLIHPNTNFATWWGVKITLPREMESLIERGRWDTLLYCPDVTEMSNEIDLFEKDDHTNSLSFAMQSAFTIIERENTYKATIRCNFDQLALPHFRVIVKEWQKDQDGHDSIPKNPAIVFNKSFAPTENDYIAPAYEKVRRALRERSLRNYEHLMISWRTFLEKLMFANVPWSDSEKTAFMKEWELNIFGCSNKRPRNHDGRWEQALAIDRPTAGKLLNYFIDRFVTNPSKYKKDGEIACILWTLIWIAQDPNAKDATLTKILALETAAVDKERPEVIFDKVSIEISMGLHGLLTILRGSSETKRHRRLFEHISRDYLENALKEASIAVFGSDVTPISPAAFLTLPHPMRGSRLSRKQIERFRSLDPGSEAGWARRQFFKTFKEAQAKKPPSSS